ncbi:hypothetical protein CFIMG_006354RAa [Ceratocystis fimbriata CBS 114723]|uniref:Uncharacterized protein n=1 Tax=Ceratocystis fimbriata CBS 114723 TaxID=1035309 RepID=A0A2C5WWY7_9PEZI|nr:hypothetical protein CFIMG_006354RAa [Ceratocystis fimbriata CBS 114723]
MEALAMDVVDNKALYALGLLITAVALIIAKLRSKSRCQRPSILPEKQPQHVLPVIGSSENVSLETTDPEKFRPWKPIYNITMAIERDSPSNLICMDREYAERIAIRKAIIEEFPEKSHGYMPEGVDSIHEIYSYLTETYLPTRYPTIFSVVDGRFKNAATGQSYPIFSHINLTHEKGAILFDPRAILRALGEIVQEDLFLLKQDPENGPHRLVAFVCCCPSGFDPSEKLGLSLRDIHAPVPSYDKIGASMERFFSRLETGKNVKRTNWSVTTHSNLFDVSLNHIKGDISVEEQDQEINCETSFARIERQTLSRLPRTGTVMFSFKTYLYPLRDIKAEGLGPKLAESIEGLKVGNAPGMWKYKGAIRWGKSVCEYMRS